MVEIINPIASPLKGRVLIEASAGTGKTYTIATLIIRYLLGLDDDKPLSLSEILIVTFTKAATAELRIRVYNRILETQKAFKADYSEDIFIQNILNAIPKQEYKKAMILLNEAESAMSDANIFTIHGFCQRFLKQNPINSKLPFNAILEISDAELKEQAAKQFWREECYYFSQKLTSIAYQEYKTPNNILSTVTRFLNIADTLSPPKTIEELEEAIFSSFNDAGELDSIAIQNLLWEYATYKFAKIFAQLKTKHGILFFDDLIKETHIVVKNNYLSQKEQTSYKVAMIDEFQDTDKLQYEIFSTLFGQNDRSTLLMIGDPKQAIYKFRGADINTYLSAKEEANLHYSLGTNYRSSEALVLAVNELFSLNSTPFLHKDIPFYPVDTPEKAKQNYLALNQQKKHGISISYINENCAKGVFREFSAQTIVTRIQELLSYGVIHEQGYNRPVEHKDITILVRGRSDANAIIYELQKAKVPAVYLSDQSNVFSSESAKLLQIFLASLLDKRNQELMKQTFASLLYQLTLNELNELLNEQSQYETFLQERDQCVEEWDSLGIIPMFDRFLHRHHRIHRFRNDPDFDRIMTDLRHLCELLHVQSLLLPTKSALLNWFYEQILSADSTTQDNPSSSNSLRLESEFNVISIMTIHSSKGLEFPITLIPSVFETHEPKPPFVTTLNQTSHIDFTQDPTKIKNELVDEKAEYMRLLYVALTRAKYYCEFVLPRNLLNRTTPVNQQTAYATLFNLEENDAFDIKKLSTLTKVNIIDVLNKTKQQFTDTIIPTQSQLSASKFIGKIDRSWGVSSFSQLTHNIPYSPFSIEKNNEILLESDLIESEDNHLFSIYSFPKGAHVGNFIHSLFENHSPNDLLNETYLTKILKHSSLSDEVNQNIEQWQTILHTWLEDIFQNQLVENLSFKEALQNNALHELEFLFPVTEPLSANKFNNFINHYRQSSSSHMDFFTLQGMLKGFVDLIFQYKGKYYIVDYKTNHLGNNQSNYAPKHLKTAIEHAYYDVQYLIYSVALMRYLKSRLPNFSYKEHFGGVFYLFVRGMSKEGDNGIYFTKPTELEINALNELMGDHL